MLRRAPKTINLTKAAIEKLPPPEGRRLYHYDEKIPGLAICVTPAGTKVFYLIRRVGTRVERIRIGGWPEWTVDQARTKATEINGGLTKGINPNAIKRQARNARILGESFEWFLTLPTRGRKQKRPRAAATVHQYRLLYDAHLACWRDRKLLSITREDVEALHNDLGSRCGHYLANRTVAVVRALYNAEIKDNRYAGPNPAIGVLPFEEHDRERFLEQDELPRFFEALDAEPSEKVRDALKLLLWTGQRRMNVLSMRWAEIHLERGIWLIPHTKSGRPHRVPLVAAALEILNRRAKNKSSEYVFPGRHGRGHLRDVMRQWRELLKRAGITNLRPHDLRRSLASWQTMTGAGETIVGRTLGHSDPAATAIYARVDLQTVRESMESATAKILALAERKKAAVSG